jgi:PAS domain S-box-containing protein
MAVTREKKSKSTEPNIYYGDIALLADESFRCLRLLKVEDGMEQVSTKFYGGKSIVEELGIGEFLPEIERELSDHRRWRGVQVIEQNRWLLEIVQPEQGTLKERYVHLTHLGGHSAAETKNPFSFLQAANGMSSLVWQGPSVKKDEDTEYSAGILSLTGYTAEEINKLPGKFLSLISFEDSAAVGKIISDFSFEHGKKTAEAVYRIIRKDGNIRWVKESFAMLRDATVRSYIYAGIITDITNQKEYELKLLESEERLVEINQAKDRFINILSHDLRAPFTSILGFSEILLNEPNLPLKEKNEYLTYIYDASQNQLQFINYLLDWSRLRTGSLKIESQRLRAQAIIYNCVSMLTGNAIRKNITIQVEVSETLYVQADERLLTQVIMNLLSNSIKFSPDNTTIEIHAGVFNESQAEFVVRDNGVGISLEDQQKVFSIEKSFTKEGTHGEKGSGFGLALVREIVVKHGGEIWFYSEPMKGAEFHFTLPFPSNTVLLVENNRDLRNACIEIITEAFPEFNILTAENGYEAMGLVANQMPNLIIFNHHMPLMNGLQFWEAMRRNETNLKVPFIVLAESLPEDIETAYFRQNVEAILKTPPDRTELLNVLQMTLH